MSLNDLYGISVKYMFGENEIDSSDVVRPLSEIFQIYILQWFIQDDCNLNCVGCSVAANGLSEEKGSYELVRFKRELDRIHQLQIEIYNITFMGGEPLLNRGVKDYIEYARERFPYTILTLTTNGLLLRNLSSEVIKCFEKNKVKILLSLYPPFHDDLDELVVYLKENNLNYEINVVESFGKGYSETPINNKKKAFEECSLYCCGVRNGIISNCSKSLFVERINSKFGTTLPSQGRIDLFDNNLDARKIVKELEKPIELCAYCTGNFAGESIGWNIGRESNKEDYFL